MGFTHVMVISHILFLEYPSVKAIKINDYIYIYISKLVLNGSQESCKRTPNHRERQVWELVILGKISFASNIRARVGGTSF